MKGKVVDVHTHMYPPEYVRILESRTTIPLVRKFGGSLRLILLSEEVESLKKAEEEESSSPPGRPLTEHYSSLDPKIRFMDTHGIDVSVLSLANPWLDFVDPAESAAVAKRVDDDFSAMCARHPGRLYFFAAPPLTASTTEIEAAVARAAKLPYCRGVVLGTSGLGRGLDDPELLPVLDAVAAAGLPVFLHPHYGLPNEVWGPRAAEYGHVLPLALGFPMETTIAVARMYLAGVFDRVRGLRVLLAHSGGTLPFLAGRIESCVRHDGHLARTGRALDPGRRTVWDVLREQVYLDATIYSEVGLRAAVDASGADRLLFGTDHPFFPPLESDAQGQWESVGVNVVAAQKALGEGTPEYDAVMGGNAVKILRLYGE